MIPLIGLCRANIGETTAWVQNAIYAVVSGKLHKIQAIHIGTENRIKKPKKVID